MQATIFVQLAARKVVWENSQLRDLLASQGFTSRDIEKFLHDRERTKPMRTSGSLARDELQDSLVIQAHEHQDNHDLSTGGPTSHRPKLRVWQKNSAEQHDLDTGSVIDENEGRINASLVLQHPQNTWDPPVHDPGPMNSSGLVFNTLSHLDRVHTPAVNKCSWDSLDLSLSTESEQQSLPLPVSGCCCQVAHTQTFSGRKDLMLEMSCETAASIIAGMRGNEDEEQVRFELGCARDKQCNVKNIKVLQVMERE